MNPFLDDSFHISWSQLTPDHVVNDISAALAQAEKNIADLCSQKPGTLTFDSVLLAFERATDPLSQAWGKVTHLDAVCNSDDLRAVHNQMLPAVTEFWARLPLNADLWHLIKDYAETDDAKSLTGVKKRFLHETVIDFHQAGADLPANLKIRLEALEAELAQATQKFSENVLDSTNAWELLIVDPSKLEGLPPTSRDAARSDAKAKGHGTDDAPVWRLTQKMPSVIPVMEHLADPEIRRQVWEGSCAIGHTGQYENGDLVWKILALRQEKAEILGFKNFADLVLARRMAKDGAAALTFVEDLHDRSADAFARDTRDLEIFRAGQTGSAAETFEPWDLAFWAERQRQALYAFDDEDLRPFFPIDGILLGMFRIAEKIFGIEIRQRKSAYREPGSPPPADPESPGAPVEVWHPEVKFYEIYDRSGDHLGSFYADWHPRDSKRSGAWMNYLKTGTPASGDHRRTPHLGLICGNMTPAVDGNPALLTHDEVETVFHEFGHLLHHLLGEVPIKSLNGVNVAWDFVELPSQIMENFCWDRRSLDFFARHHESGETIPDHLFNSMLAARNYRSATAMMRQLALGKLDLELHINYPTASDKDLDSLSLEILQGYLIPVKTHPPTMARRFGHLFANPTGYAAGYYSYKWAEVLDADAFTRFAADGVLSEHVGREFREKILSKGNSEDPATLFENFMGREPDLEALLIRSGLLA